MACAALGVLFCLLGGGFFLAGPKAALFVSGFSTLPPSERARYDTAALSRDYARRFLGWGVLLLAGAGASALWSGWAALLALATYSELKNIILVDEDVDIFDSDDILWAMTTRMQGDVSITTIPGIRGHQLDPSQTPEYSPSIRGNGISCKTFLTARSPGR